MKKIIFVAIICLFTNACAVATTVVDVGNAVSTTFSSSRSFKEQMLDHKIKAQIIDEFVEQDADFISNLSVTVYNRKVLLTGLLPSIDKVADAVKSAWSAPEVEQVINNIIIDIDPSLNDASKDAYLRNRVARKLLFTSQISSSNYKFKVVNRVLYIIGEYQNEQEKAILDYSLKQVDGIKKIVSYITLAQQHN